MQYSDIRQARVQAQGEVLKADTAVRGAVELIAGRLKVANVAPWLLRNLKRELKDFNMRTDEWKE